MPTLRGDSRWVRFGGIVLRGSEKFGVPACRSQQLLVRAGFDDTSVVEYGNAIGCPDGRESVGDEDGGAIFHQFVEGYLQCPFGCIVQCAGRLVEHQDGRVAQYCPRDGETLLLTAGEPVSAFADEGVVAVVECGDEIVDLRDLCGVLDFGVGGLGFGEAQVLANRRMKQVGLLRDDADEVCDRGGREIPQVDAVDARPCVGSCNRAARYPSVVFPDPVDPTRARVLPAGTSSVMLCSVDWFAPA